MRVLQIRYDESEIWVVKFKRLGDRWEVKERVTTSGDRTVSSYNSCFFFFFFLVLISAVEKEISFLENYGKEINLGLQMLREAIKGEKILPKDLFYLTHSMLSWQRLKVERFLIKCSYFLRSGPHWSPCPRWHHSLVEPWRPCLTDL